MVLRVAVLAGKLPGKLREEQQSAFLLCQAAGSVRCPGTVCTGELGWKSACKERELLWHSAELSSVCSGAWILSLETRTPVRGRGVVTEQNRAFGNELGRSFRRSKGKKSSHHPSCFIAVHVNKLQAGGVCCRGEEALLPHEHMREGVFPTSVFVNTQLILSSTGCQRRSLESLPGLGLFALLCFRCKNHLELISTVKEVPRQFVGMAFLPGQPSLMTGLSKQLQQCKHLPLELSQLLDG